MRRVYKEIKYWGQLLFLPFYCLTHLIPRNKKIWVFGSTFGRRFADNPKYFYLYVSQYQAKNTRAIWISKNRDVIELIKTHDLEGYYLYTLKGIWFSLRAKVYIYDNYSKDICFLLSGGAVKINMWHGIPLKKIQKDNIFDTFRNPKNIREKLYAIPRRISDEKPSDYVLTTSNKFAAIFTSAFQTAKVLVAGYPRNDILISESVKNVLSKQEWLVYKKLKNAKKTSRIVLYMPTFRDSEEKFFDTVSIEDFCEFLKKEQIIFCVKLHPKSKLVIKFDKIASDYIVIIDPEADPYPICALSNILITDYSSIYFDYLLTGKPIIFFPYDYEEYLGGSRELYFDYDEFTPGTKARSMEDLKAALVDEDRFVNERLVLKNKVFDDTDCLGSESLYKLIRDLFV